MEILHFDEQNVYLPAIHDLLLSEDYVVVKW